MACAFGITNLALASTSVITVSAATAQNPVSKLLTPHVGERWLEDDDEAYIDIDLGSAQSFDTVMLAGVTRNPDFIVEASTVAAGADDVFGSGTLSGTPEFDDDYGLFVYLRATPVSARYIRINLAQSGVASLAAGVPGVYLRDAPAINFAAPWAQAAEPGSARTIGQGGQTFVDKRRGYFRQNVRFEAFSETERTGFLRTLGLGVVNEGHRDILWIPDTESSNLSADCLYGYVDGAIALSQDQYVVPPIFAAEFAIRQRL